MADNAIVKISVAAVLACTPAIRAQFTVENPYQPRALAVKTELHTHTDIHRPPQLEQKYKDLWGANIAVAITDKDVLSGGGGTPGVLHLRGVEECAGPVSGYDCAGQHITTYGVSSQSPAATGQGVIDDAVRQGGLASLAHPNYPGRIWTDADIEQLRNYTSLEVYNRVVCGGLCSNAEEKWDRILTKGRKVWGISVDDYKDDSVQLPGQGYVVFHVNELTEASILEAFRNGNFYAVYAPNPKAGGPDLSVRVSGKTITVSTTAGPGIFQWIKQFGAKAQGESGQATSDSYKLAGDEQYVRVKFTRTSDGAVVFTNPLFVRAQASARRSGAGRERTAPVRRPQR